MCAPLFPLFLFGSSMCCRGGGGNSMAHRLDGSLVARLEAATAAIERRFGVTVGGSSGAGKGSSGAAALEATVARIEAAAARLDGGKASERAPAGAAAVPASSVAAGEQSPMLVAYDECMGAPVARLVELAAALGGPVAAQGQLVGQLMVHHRRVLRLAPQSGKPGPKVLDLIYAATNECVNAIQACREGHRGHAQEQHLAAVAEMVQAVAWLDSPTPAPFIKEMIAAGQFYSNRVLSQARGSDPTSVEWVTTLVQVFTALHDFVKQWHATGLAWGKQIRSMTFWSNALADTAPGEGDADEYRFNSRLKVPIVVSKANA